MGGLLTSHVFQNGSDSDSAVINNLSSILHFCVQSCSEMFLVASLIELVDFSNSGSLASSVPRYLSAPIRTFSNSFAFN